MLEMPKIDYAEYLIGFANEVGLYHHGSFGIVPISWVDVKAWSDLTSTPLTAWESSTILLLSKTFVSYFNEVNEKSVPPPYQPAEIDKKQVSNKIGSMFRSIAIRKQIIPS